MRDEDEDGEVPTDHTHVWEIHLYHYYYLHQKELPLTQFCGLIALALADKRKIRWNYNANQLDNMKECGLLEFNTAEAVGT
jgi:hypothetical protein